MREKARIKRILKMIEKLWLACPDMRLGQLLFNFGGFNDNNYHTEDNITETNLENSLNSLSTPFFKKES